MPAPIGINEYVAQMQTMLSRGLTKEELESIEECRCGAEYCSGYKLRISTPNSRIEV